MRSLLWFSCKRKTTNNPLRFWAPTHHSSLKWLKRDFLDTVQFKRINLKLKLLHNNEVTEIWWPTVQCKANHYLISWFSLKRSVWHLCSQNWLINFTVQFLDMIILVLTISKKNYSKIEFLRNFKPYSDLQTLKFWLKRSSK